MATVSVSEAAPVGGPSSVPARCGSGGLGSHLVPLVWDRCNCCGCLASALGNQWVPALSISLPRVREAFLHETYRTDQDRQRLVDQVLPLRVTRPVFKNVRLSYRLSRHHHLLHASRLSKILLGDQQVTLLCDAG
jgi:hypothetical protein